MEGSFQDHDGLQSAAGRITGTLCFRSDVFSLARHSAVWLDRRADIFCAFRLPDDRDPGSGERKICSQRFLSDLSVATRLADFSSLFWLPVLPGGGLLVHPTTIIAP